MRTALTLAAAVVLGTAASAAEPAPPTSSAEASGVSEANGRRRPGFTKKPTASKAGDKTRIEFAVDRETDVAVYVEDANGRIVRHLVAGVLGKNPPEPLKAGALSQSIEWDGRDDDGKPAAGGPFKVRVGLGLRASYAGQPFADKDQAGPNKIESVLGLAAGPDGRAYVLASCGALVWGGTKLHVFRRDGAYEKTIKPFPADTPTEKARAAGAFVNSFGAFNPLVHRPPGFQFYPADDVGHGPAVTRDGQLILAVGGGRLAILDPDGGIPGSAYAGPALGAGLSYAKYPCLAAAADGKSVYAVGLVAGKGKPASAVYRAPLPERGPAEVWFGDAASAGGDNGHLNDARALAVDGQGHLLVADLGNNRVLVLNEKDKTVAGSLPVPAPAWVGAHPKTGAVYVLSGEAVVKFSGWENGKELARLALPKPSDKNQFWKLALDASAEPPVLWAAEGRKLMRCEDRGEKLTDPAPAGCFPARFFYRPTADPTRQLVAWKTVDGYSADLHIMEEETGKTRVIHGREVAGAGTELGRSHRLGPDGSIYGQDDAIPIRRHDRDGKRKPFEATLKNPRLQGLLPVGTTGTTSWERDFYVDRKNDIYVRASGPEYHGLMTIQVYDQSGAFKRTAVWTVSDGMYGPRVDPKGNIYIMETVKAPGQRYPEEFAARVKGLPAAGKQTTAGWYDWIYGSIVKFGPEGGAVWFAGAQLSPLDYEGWRGLSPIANLRTTGGALTGTLAGKAPKLSFPRDLYVESAAHNTVSFRLKNDGDGTKATLYYHRVKEDYFAACGPGFSKVIEIKPNSDFTEYSFDLSGEKDWKEDLYNLSLVPTDGTKGSLSIDWVRIGKPESKLVWNFDAEDGPDKKLPATMKKEQIDRSLRPGGATLQGALWWRPWFSPVGDCTTANQCHCTASDFDVDDFGRVFAPDTGRFRVGVLDTNGNEIIAIGAYGNQDCCGPDSYVLDPAGKFLRPRQASDPKDLASPFAKPEIAFAWIIGLAVTDRYAYVDDAVNKRVLRVKLDYAAMETAAIP
jgi:hypothetical protein